MKWFQVVTLVVVWTIVGLIVRAAMLVHAVGKSVLKG